ncbi:type II toxin-antitoxin system ParD family antitoxin [Methylobacterium sp. Leaf399]|uniref:type II toxin-antitoxin system ParD family antitoxin n=1 Tax=Methylobacterium sp. Leaf108 TaxID=1736256 RepID=UPI0009EA8910
MPDVDLGQHFDGFIQRQVESGRFESASDVVRAALRLLEDHEASLGEHRAALKRSIDAAFDDPRPSLPAGQVFASLRAYHAEAMKAEGQGG